MNDPSTYCCYCYCYRLSCLFCCLFPIISISNFLVLVLCLFHGSFGFLNLLRGILCCLVRSMGLFLAVLLIGSCGLMVIPCSMSGLGCVLEFALIPLCFSSSLRDCLSNILAVNPSIWVSVYSKFPFPSQTSYYSNEYRIICRLSTSTGKQCYHHHYF